MAQRQSKYRSQNQGGFDSQIGIMALSTWCCSRLGPPTGDRIRRKPDCQAAAIAQGCIVLAPVRDPMALAGKKAESVAEAMTVLCQRSELVFLRVSNLDDPKASLTFKDERGARR